MSEVLNGEASGDRVAARLHDETFLLCCQNVKDPEALRLYIQTVKARMEAPLSDGTRITVSAGTAACAHDGPGSHRRAADRANLALRTAQRLGRRWPCACGRPWRSTTWRIS